MKERIVYSFLSFYAMDAQSYCSNNVIISIALCFVSLAIRVEVVIILYKMNQLKFCCNLSHETSVLFLCIYAGMLWLASLKRVDCLHYMLDGERYSAGMFLTLSSR